MADQDITPMVFKLRGTKCDAQLNVFDRVFHVHSAILKQYSHWFFKFMDKVDKEPLPSGPFRYVYITKYDEDRTWSLGTASDTKVCHSS